MWPLRISMNPPSAPVKIMGILNVTPDSFSDGGNYLDTDRALQHAVQMLDEGADIIDVGGESTRPPGAAYGDGARPITEQEQLDRVIPVIQRLVETRPRIQISIDTSKAQVARAAVEAGAGIINDVSAGTRDEHMFAVAAKLAVPVILMHGYGPTFNKARIEDYQYEDVVCSVFSYLQDRISLAREAGCVEIMADVGIGFAKTFKDNMTLLRHHDRFLDLGVPLLIGVSRKSSIGIAMGRDTTPADRITGSIAAACWAVERGASIVRTHDVRETRDALNVIQHLQQA
jgi:dihydropteroate synthase